MVSSSLGQENIIYIDEAVTLHGLFNVRVKRSGEHTAYEQFDRLTEEWQRYSWNDIAAKVGIWQSILAKLKLNPGDRVALSLKNSVEWIAFEQAALGLGLVVIPLYTDDRPDNIAFILADAAVKVLLLQDEKRWLKIVEVINEDYPLQAVYLQDSPERLDSGPAKIAVNDVSVLLTSTEVHPLKSIACDPHQLATIVYTSGTTGRPKGVMLSHHNILSIAHSGLTMISVSIDDIFLSFLPLSHTLERTAGYYLPMMSGSKVAFSRSIAQLAEDMQIIHPTIMVVVPRIFERIYTRIQGQLEKGSYLKRKIFNVAVKVGWLHFEVQQGRRNWNPLLLLNPLLQRVVGKTITEKLGGRLRLTVSGGAALSQQIAETFIALGVPILQGYGLTETSPVISVNTPEDNDPKSVGIPLRGVKVRIGPDNELQVKSPGVMLGYWNNHAATRKMIDHNGWLSTGDQVHIENNHIYITGRIKDILVLSNGEKVPPGDMEMAIALEPLFEQVLVIGEGKMMLAALIVLNGDLWPGFAQNLGVDPLSSSSLTEKVVTQRVLKMVQQQLHDFPAYAKIRRIHLTLEPWSIDNNLLTPTMKIKRPKVIEYYRDEIAKLYR